MRVWVVLLAMVAGLAGLVEGATREGRKERRGNMAVGKDGTLHINGTGDIRLGPGWDGTVYIGNVDLLATLRNLTAEMREMREWRDAHVTQGHQPTSTTPAVTTSTTTATITAQMTTPTTATTTTAMQVTTTIPNNTTTGTAPCDGATALPLKCSSVSSREEIANLGVCEVAWVVDCCCEEFYALRRVNGDVSVASGVRHLQFGNVARIDGDVVVPGEQDEQGVLASIDFGGVTWVGGNINADHNDLSSVDFGNLASVGGDLHLHNNDLSSVDFGNLASVGGDLYLHNNDLSSVDFGNLASVTDDLALSNNALTSVHFGNLTSVGNLALSNNNFTRVDFGKFAIVGSLYFSDNDRLTSVDFGNLTSVDYAVYLHNNNQLTSVDCQGLGPCVCSDAGVSLTNCPPCCGFSFCGC